MEIKKLRELLKLLRSQGVLQYQTTELNLVLSDNFVLAPTKSRAEEIMEDEKELTPEEEAERILFYSATHPTESIPEDN